MVRAATTERVYLVIEAHQSGFRLIETENFKSSAETNHYRKIGKKRLAYVNYKNFFLLCEEAGGFNRKALSLLNDALNTRDWYGRSTGYVVGRERLSFSSNARSTTSSVAR